MMEQLLNDFWWIPVFSVPLLAFLIWIGKKQVSDETTPSQRNRIMAMGIFAGLIGALYPSATRPSASFFTFPRVLLAFVVAGLIGTALSLVLVERRKRRSPNQAL